MRVLLEKSKPVYSFSTIFFKNAEFLDQQTGLQLKNEQTGLQLSEFLLQNS